MRVPRQTCTVCGKLTRIASNVSLAGEDHDALVRRLKTCRLECKKMGTQAVQSVHACEELIREHARVSINLQPESLLNLFFGRSGPISAAVSVTIDAPRDVELVLPPPREHPSEG